MRTNIKQYYIETYPTDELGNELNEFTTFAGLYKALIKNEDVYTYIGVHDSLIRERCFFGLSEFLELDYQEIYEMWLEA
jgi:hypothetical protein